MTRIFQTKPSPDRAASHRQVNPVYPVRVAHDGIKVGWQQKLSPPRAPGFYEAGSTYGVSGKKCTTKKRPLNDHTSPGQNPYRGHLGSLAKPVLRVIPWMAPLAATPRGNHEPPVTICLSAGFTRGLGGLGGHQASSQLRLDMLGLMTSYIAQRN